MKKPHVLVFAGFGLNCEDETKFAFDLVGAKADIIHVNDLVAKPKKIREYEVLAFPGGFSYGDDMGSGNAYANKVRNHLWPEILECAKKDTLVIGICNGCQILVSLGLVPALNGKYGKREVALLHNSSTRYVARWTDMKSESETPWLWGISHISLPIAHGEGRLHASDEILHVLEKKHLVALRYERGLLFEYQHLPENPTGTARNIAALTNENGRILGIMPHPERALFFTQLPNWTVLKEQYEREGKKLPVYGPGFEIFKNAVKYFH
ncbi:phosphoribosylformylglycinamidine synthase subunit PurQ [Candidatus Gottesmanbacteria bacterium]|nr:phosphoribosylformylglycinamidine synthase subunit PurQ [Candidatus Gottesmanbacteria bacterium]